MPKKLTHEEQLEWFKRNYGPTNYWALTNEAKDNICRTYEAALKRLKSRRNKLTPREALKKSCDANSPLPKGFGLSNLRDEDLVKTLEYQRDYLKEILKGMTWKTPC